MRAGIYQAFINQVFYKFIVVGDFCFFLSLSASGWSRLVFFFLSILRFRSEMQIKELNSQEFEVILVSSGAVGIGRQRLRYRQLVNSR